MELFIDDTEREIQNGMKFVDVLEIQYIYMMSLILFYVPTKKIITESILKHKSGQKQGP